MTPGRLSEASQKLRKQHELTQEQLAFHLGVSRYTVIRIEQRTFTKRELKLFWNALKGVEGRLQSLKQVGG